MQTLQGVLVHAAFYAFWLFMYFAPGVALVMLFQGARLLWRREPGSAKRFIAGIALFAAVFAGWAYAYRIAL